MILDILIYVFLLFLVAGAIWFALRVVRIAIREGKPNITININQSDKRSELEEVPEILRTINLLLSPKDVLQIEQKKKEND